MKPASDDIHEFRFRDTAEASDYIADVGYGYVGYRNPPVRSFLSRLRDDLAGKPPPAPFHEYVGYEIPWEHVKLENGWSNWAQKEEFSADGWEKLERFQLRLFPDGHVQVFSNFDLSELRQTELLSKSVAYWPNKLWRNCEEYRVVIDEINKLNAHLAENIKNSRYAYQVFFDFNRKEYKVNRIVKEGDEFATRFKPLPERIVTPGDVYSLITMDEIRYEDNLPKPSDSFVQSVRALRCQGMSYDEIRKRTVVTGPEVIIALDGFEIPQTERFMERYLGVTACI